MKRFFKARLRSFDEPGTSAFIVIPEKIMAAFTPRKRVQVKARINGYMYRTTIVNMGHGPMIGLRKSVRESAGVTAGDTVGVTLELDLERRTVSIPTDLRRAMTKREVAAFESMSYTHRKEYVEAIEGAKREETRAKRIMLAVVAARSRL